MPSGSRPAFLKLPERSINPRRIGLKHVLDRGYLLFNTQDLLALVSDFIDVWKFGCGTSYLDPAVKPKIAAPQAADIKVCTGSTLLELVWQQGRTRESSPSFFVNRGWKPGSATFP